MLSAMELSLCLPFLALMLVPYSHSIYVALAPSEFHPGWKYAVPLTVRGVTNGQQVTVTGNIYNNGSPRSVYGSGQIVLADGQTGKLEIQVRSSIDASVGNDFILELVGSGGLTFTNRTSITISSLNHLAFIQTDKKIYKAGQTVRIRALIVDKDLIPVTVPMQLSIENPYQSILAQYDSNSTKSVFETTFKLMEFPDLGIWKITLKSDSLKLEKVLEFTVEEYVLPTFEVSASVDPGYLVVNSAQSKVTVSVSARYTYGKGVMGDVQVTVLNGNKVVSGKITDPSGVKDLEMDLRDDLLRYSNILLLVKVTDETKRTYNKTVEVKVVSQPVVIEIDKERSDMVYQNGTPYRAVVTFLDPAGKPLNAEILENDLTVTVDEGYPGDKVIFRKTYSLNTGMTQVVVNIPSLISQVNSLNLKASLLFKGVTYENTQVISRYLTLGIATLNARWITMNNVLSLGGLASFAVDVSSNSQFDSISYIIISRGNIQALGTVTPGQEVTVNVTTAMCPNGKLVVYGITAAVAGVAPEIIADSLNLRLDHCQEKTVTPSVTQGNTLRTGSDATVRMTVGWSDTNRTQAVGVHEVFLLGVDTSNILLLGHNDIDSSRVLEELENFSLKQLEGSNGFMPMVRKRDIWGSRYPMYQEYPRSTGDLLKELGVIAVTDTIFYVVPERSFIMDDRVMMAAVPEAAGEQPMFKGTATNAGLGKQETVETSTVTIRKEFPETWIWVSGMTNGSGVMEYTSKVPDSITSWTLTAFAIKNNSELAVTANPFKLNAFNPFFVSLNLPYSIRRTETFELRATVFNYETEDMQTTVKLTPSTDFDIVGEVSKDVQAKANSAASVSFMILASKVGTIDLQVTATGVKASRVSFTDQVNRKLIVRPEGIERMRAITFPVILSAEQREFSQNVVLDFSPWTLADVVPDSRRAAFKITGDMMGNALEGIDKLVTQPTGCGEQNMITTIPNIYAMTYLTAINDLNPDFATKATGYMIEGYQRQMTYKRNDDGYSAWGPSDDASSTWLTAFVLRSFSAARKFVPSTVQPAVLTGALRFLFEHQNEKGQFYEQGRVLHQDMTGGAGTGDSLSVYILLSIMEAKLNGLEIPSQDIDKFNKAVSFLGNVTKGAEVKSRQFLSALCAYTLALVEPNVPATQNKVLELIQNVIDSGAPWLSKETAKSDTEFSWHQPAGPSSIEVTSYCILAYVHVGREGDARELVLWLQKNQNSIGGYSSTQDTVMALQAISEYSAKFAQAALTTVRSVFVTVMDPAPNTSYTTSIDRSNSKLLQIQELPNETNKINVRVTGDLGSLAVVKIVWYFHTLATSDPLTSQATTQENNKLKISTTTSMVRPGLHKVRACINKDKDLDYNSMVVVTFNLPSGFDLNNVIETRENNPAIPRIEQAAPDQLHFYLHEPADQCMEAVIEEKIKVENLKPGTVQMYAYYSPETRDEGEIRLALQCAGDECDLSHATTFAIVSPFLLAVAISLLLSLVIAL